MLYKEIHIGKLISLRVAEQNITIDRICNFLDCQEAFVENLFTNDSVDTQILLKISKLLEYDFFRLYSQHLILYAPPISKNNLIEKKTSLPHFKKNIYTREIIDFILEMIETGEKSKEDIIKKYRIPKTTLYKWIIKYKK